ncbi:MAG: hypothetical protein E7379_02355 [Clostridiales bacterium]|nr:hypothetical protein [Clostridiales bacterium]
MKKILVLIFAFCMVLVGGGVALTSGFSYAEDEHAAMEFVYNITELHAAINKGGNAIILGADIKGTPILDAHGKVIGYEPVEINVAKLVSYSGILNGYGFSIINPKFYYEIGEGEGPATSSYMGLIPQASKATIKDLKIEGEITYDLANLSSGGYVGGIIGFGENTSISNCEINATDIKFENAANKNFNFGVIAGGIKGTDSKVEECLAYYNCNIALDEAVRVSIGGLVGELTYGEIANCLNFGNISYAVKNGIEAKENSYQYVGGLVGALYETTSKVRNCIYAGTLSYTLFESSYIGAIVGACPTNFTESNIIYDYYTQGGQIIYPIGNKTDIVKTNLQKLSNVNASYTTVNQAVLQDKTLFYGALKSWDFDKVWDYRNSRIALQRFEMFEFKISDNFEVGSVFSAIKKPTLDNKDYHYGSPVMFTVQLNDDKDNNCVGWFKNLTIYKGGNPIDAPADLTEDAANGKWTFSLQANASTAGTYSFSVEQENCDCSIMTEDIAKGGVRMLDASSATTSLSLRFNYSVRNQTVVATSNGIYTFAGWDIYLLNAGEWTRLNNDEQKILDEELKIKYDRAAENNYQKKDDSHIFNQQFKLVATYTENPANVVFEGDDNVLLVTLNGEEFDGTNPIKVPKTARSIVLKVTVKNGYELDIQALHSVIKDLATVDYTVDEYFIPVNFQNDTIVDEDGNKTYSFNLDISAVEEIRYKEIVLNEEDTIIGFIISFKTLKTEGGASGDLMWLWLTLAGVGVLLVIGIVVIIMVRRKKYGGKGSAKGGKKGGSVKNAPKAKAESYRDYFI